MLPSKLAFVDTETTGTNASFDRIIEIGILRVENNKIVSKYQTLLNPEKYLSPYIENMTGIAARDLETAPTFYDKKDEIEEMLSDCIFVAHNVRFDYGFLKNEFKRYGISFSPKHFCTVKLARSLFPQWRSHNLDSVIEQFGFQCKNRHRAFDDAQILWKFYQKIQKQFPLEKIENALNLALKKPTLPINLSSKILDKLPESPGVYIFYGSQNSLSSKRVCSDSNGIAFPDQVEDRLSTPRNDNRNGQVEFQLNLKDSQQNFPVPLYIGKSINIRERVLSHFSSDYLSGVEMNIAQQITHVETILTSGELGALFKEASLIKGLQPIYNKKLRLRRQLTILKKKQTPDGYDTVSIETMIAISVEDLNDILGIFRSKKQAKDFLISLSKTHHLCQKLFGIEKTKGVCFGYHLGWCRGACKNRENPLQYNSRFLIAFFDHKIKSWPFSDPIIIEEKNELEDSYEKFLVDKWCYLGSVTSQDVDIHNFKNEYIFDLDMYKILVNYIFSEKNQKKIKPVRNLNNSFQVSPYS